jgi:hypothetical protein
MSGDDVAFTSGGVTEVRVSGREERKLLNQQRERALRNNFPI